MGSIEKSTRYYSDKEIKILKRYYDKLSISELRVELFKVHDHARSENAINHKLRDLGLIEVKDNSWSSENLRVIIDNFETKTFKEIGNLLKRSSKSIEYAIYTHLPHLRTRKKVTAIFNDKKNIDKLKDNLHLSNKQLSKLFDCSYHTIQAIKYKLKLGATKHFYTKDEIEYIIDNYGVLSVPAIAKKLNRSYPSVKVKIDRLINKKQISNIYIQSSWSLAEKEYLRENFENLTYKELSKYLKKNQNSISYMSRKLGLKKEVQNLWSDFEINYLKDNYKTSLLKNIAKSLNRSYYSVNAKAQDLLLSKDGIARLKRGKYETK